MLISKMRDLNKMVLLIPFSASKWLGNFYIKKIDKT